MAFRDTWHRTLVYFGIAEERDDAYEDDYDDDQGPAPIPEPEADVEDRYRERPNVRRLTARRRRDEIDDIFAEDDMPSRSERGTRTLRPVGSGGGGGGGAGPAGGGGRNGSRSDARVHLVVPQSFNDVKDVADKFKDSIPVIINLQGADSDLVRRLVDFGSGLTYALDGGMQKIADKVFLLTPRNVEVSAEERARILEKGFFNQS
ncbi:MAG: cell division protein SepF [Solirubrobacteraceae bacterium]